MHPNMTQATLKGFKASRWHDSVGVLHQRVPTQPSDRQSSFNPQALQTSDVVKVFQICKGNCLQTNKFSFQETMRGTQLTY